MLLDSLGTLESRALKELKVSREDLVMMEKKEILVQLEIPGQEEKQACKVLPGKRYKNTTKMRNTSYHLLNFIANRVKLDLLENKEILAFLEKREIGVLLGHWVLLVLLETKARLEPKVLLE